MAIKLPKNKIDVLLNKIGFIPIKVCILKTWVLPMCLIYGNVVFYSNNIFPNNGPDEKFRC